MSPAFTSRYKNTLILLLIILLPACSNMPPSQTDSQIGKPKKPVENKINREFQQALALMQKKNLRGAAEKFHDLIERYPQMTGAWANLGLIHIKAREWEKAQQALQQAVALNPKLAPAYNYLGVVERNLGQFKQAEQAYKKAIDADPAYAIAWLNLGILYDIYMDKPAQALPQYEQYQHLTGKTDKKVGKWIVELKRRIPKQSKLSPRIGEQAHG